MRSSSGVALALALVSSAALPLGGCDDEPDGDCVGVDCAPCPYPLVLEVLDFDDIPLPARITIEEVPEIEVECTAQQASSCGVGPLEPGVYTAVVESAGYETTMMTVTLSEPLGDPSACCRCPAQDVQLRVFLRPDPGASGPPADGGTGDSGSGDADASAP
ncbi:MAG: hypothetical protein PVI30_10075 [Myxococcales bacterium]|jgi:hypothetical protein